MKTLIVLKATFRYSKKIQIMSTHPTLLVGLHEMNFLSSSYNQIRRTTRSPVSYLYYRAIPLISLKRGNIPPFKEVNIPLLLERRGISPEYF
jgi:hypothetical protein